MLQFFLIKFRTDRKANHLIHRQLDFHSCSGQLKVEQFLMLLFLNLTINCTHKTVFCIDKKIWIFWVFGWNLLLYLFMLHSKDYWEQYICLYLSFHITFPHHYCIYIFINISIYIYIFSFLFLLIYFMFFVCFPIMFKIVRNKVA